MSVANDQNSKVSGDTRVSTFMSSLSKPSIYAASTLFITALGSATTLLAPALLTSTEFANFILLASFFQLASRLDFGLSELADRYGARKNDWEFTTTHFIKLRWIIGFTCLPLLLLIALGNSPICWGRGVMRGYR